MIWLDRSSCHDSRVSLPARPQADPQVSTAPIRSEVELDRAIAVVHPLVIRMDELAPEEQDYLEILNDIVEKYESEIYPDPVVPPHVMLREPIAFRGATQGEVARATGIGESVLSELLRGKRTDGAEDHRDPVPVLQGGPGTLLCPGGRDMPGTHRGRGSMKFSPPTNPCPTETAKAGRGRPAVEKQSSSPPDRTA